jgi:hypothetical protein
MKEEIANHNNNSIWIPVLRDSLLSNTKVIPSVWVMHRKPYLTGGKIHKWKAHLHVNVSKQVKGINFWETYVPEAQWISIRLILCRADVNLSKHSTLFKPALKHLVNLNYI